ncbi:MAG: hypothetical protein JO319_00505 [Acidobacteriaceae bacterium]|nr:hypothetical protein [Acidobacteriaceae bacterium]
MRSHYTKLLIPVLALCFLASCEFDHATTGPMKEDHVTLDRGSVDRANVQLNMGAGQMDVSGGASNLFDGTIQYNVPAWQPVFTHDVNGRHASIELKQPEHVRLGGNAHYRWNLKLNDQVLLDLTANCGAGQAHFDIGQLKLRNVEVHMGAGQVDLDLRGHPTRDYDVNVRGGVGQATIRLPDNVGIWAEAHGGLGSITVTGLNKGNGNQWQNDLYDKAKVNVRVTVEGGIGEIRIIA